MTVTPTRGALQLGEVRAQAASALAPPAESDLTVFDNVVDALEPPALVLGWADPWLEPRSVNAQLWDARFQILCIAGRVDPDPGVEKLEELIAYVIGRLQADGYSWPVATSDAPRRFVIANITYLGARVHYRVPVTIGGQDA